MLPQRRITQGAEYTGERLVGVAVAFIPILIVFVSVRFWSRILNTTTLGLDDYLALISLVIQIGSSALAICFVKYAGVGYHFAYLEQADPEKITQYFKYLLAVSFYYFFGVAIPKLAILALYLRLFTTKPYRIAVYLTAAIVAATGIVCSVMSLNLCHPFNFNWDRTIPDGSCVNEQAFYLWGSLPNILTDITILILPIPMVWKLHASTRTKVSIFIAFLTGSFGLCTSIIRFTIFTHGSAVEDGTWSSVNLMTWTIVEPDVYLIAACLPTYRPVLKRLSRSWHAKPSSSSTVECASSPRSKPRVFDTAGFTDLGPDSSENVGLVPIRPKHKDLSYNEIRVQSDYDVTVAEIR